MRSRGAVCACGDVVLAVVVVLQLLPLPSLADGGSVRIATNRIYMLPTLLVGTLCLRPQSHHGSRSASLPVTLSRRAMLGVGAAALGTPKRAVADATFIAGARVAEYPSIEYMEPIIEFKQLMDALVDGANEPSQWP